MDQSSIAQAAELLVRARRQRQPIEELPLSCRPTTMAEAHAIQDAVSTALGEAIGGWKVNAPPGEELQRGALFASRILRTPAQLQSAMVPLRGVEGEIAFRFVRDLPAREQAYEREDIAGAVAAFAAIEVVDSRYRDMNAVTIYEKIADHAANGAFIYGPAVHDWQKFDITQLRVNLSIDQQVVVDKIGGHPAGDPLLPAVALANRMRTRGAGVRTGVIMTTGSCTGINFLNPGQTALVRFEGLGSARVMFSA